MTITRLLSTTGPTPQNVGERFMIGKVLFDNEDGLGATPKGQEVGHSGFQVFMRPRSFLELAFPADRSETAAILIKLHQQGRGFAAPFLDITVNEDEFAAGQPLRVVVIGHEGRARATAFAQLEPDELLPVHVFPLYRKARHLSPEFFAALRETGMVQEKYKKNPYMYGLRVKLHKIFWMGKTL